MRTTTMIWQEVDIRWATRISPPGSTQSVEMMKMIRLRSALPICPISIMTRWSAI